MLDYIQVVRKSDTKILLGENISGFPYGTTNGVWSIRCICATGRGVESHSVNDVGTASIAVPTGTAASSPAARAHADQLQLADVARMLPCASLASVMVGGAVVDAV